MDHPQGKSDEEPGAADAAAREGFEEAGAIGPIEACPRGYYRHRRRKVRRQLRCRVAVYVMAVEQRVECFPEREERAVRWFTVADARAVVRNRRLRELIARVSAELNSSGRAPNELPA